MWPTLIGAGASLLGGLLSKPKNEWVVPDYAKIRAQAEAAGFNPLTALGAAPGQVVSTPNAMGQAVQEAGLMLANNLQQQQKLAQVDDLQRQNARLQGQVQDLTLQPPVPGIYAQRPGIPTLADAHGVADGKNAAAPAVPADVAGMGVSGAAGGPSPLLTVDNGPGGDPRREVQNGPVPSDAGYMIIDNPSLGAPFRVPAAQGEMLDLGQTAILGGAWLWDRFGRAVWQGAGNLDQKYFFGPLSDLAAKRDALAATMPKGDAIFENQDEFFLKPSGSLW